MARASWQIQLPTYTCRFADAAVFKRPPFTIITPEPQEDGMPEPFNIADPVLLGIAAR